VARVWRPSLAASEFKTALEAAKREAMSSFNDRLDVVEKYWTSPPSIGNPSIVTNMVMGFNLFWTRLSIQRRHQKWSKKRPAHWFNRWISSNNGRGKALKAQKLLTMLAQVRLSFYWIMSVSISWMIRVTSWTIGNGIYHWSRFVECKIRVATIAGASSLKQLTIKDNGLLRRGFSQKILTMAFYLPRGVLTLLQPPRRIGLCAHRYVFQQRWWCFRLLYPMFS